jgi:hypothetical protein
VRTAAGVGGGGTALAPVEPVLQPAMRSRSAPAVVFRNLMAATYFR